MSEGHFKLAKRSKPSQAVKFRSYDESNLRCARIILADRAKYDKPDARFMIAWAEQVIERLGPCVESEVA